MPIVALTAAFVQDACCPKDKTKIDFYSSNTPGFILECRATGGKTYALRFRDDHNRQRQIKIGDASAITFEKAKQTAIVMRSKIVLGGDPAEDRKVKRQIPTLDEFVRDVYLPHVAATRRNYASSIAFLKHHVLPRYGSMHLDQITTQSIAEGYNDMLAKGFALATSSTLPSMLRIIYNIAKKRKTPGSDINPAVDVKVKSPNNARQRFLSIEEIERLRFAVEKSSNTQLKHIVNLSILLLCRKRELLDAKWTDFDIERRNWHIPMSKSGKARNVPLSTAALEILAQLPRWEGVPWVVPHPIRLKPFRSVYWSWDLARRAAGLSDVTQHDLRHTGASHLLAAGADPVTVSKVLGHSSLRMTERYMHVGNQTLLRSVEALGALVGSNVSPTPTPPSMSFRYGSATAK